MPGQTLRSYRSHRVYTGYIVRYGGKLPPPKKKKKWVNSKSRLRKRRVLSPYMRPNQSCCFYYSSVLSFIMTSRLKKRGEFQASLDSSYLLFGAPLKACALAVNCCDLFRPAYVHWDCRIVPSTQKKSWGNTKSSGFKVLSSSHVLVFQGVDLCTGCPPDHRSHETLISGPIV